MSRALCFRCDWEGDPEERCPRCGAPLYLSDGASAVEPPTGGGQASGAESAPEAGETTAPASSVGEPAPVAPARSDSFSVPRTAAKAARRPVAEASTREPMTPTIEGDEPVAPRPGRRQPPRSARWVAVTAAVALIAGLLWAQRGQSAPTSPRLVRALEGTLVYATAGGDGVTGRLWTVNVAQGVATKGPRTLLPDEIVAGPNEGSVGVRAGGIALLYEDLSPDRSPQRFAEGQIVAWTPGGTGVYVITRQASARGRCPLLQLTFVSWPTFGSRLTYEGPSCSTADGLAVDGLTRPFVSLAGPTDGGVYELGYKALHQVVPDFALLGVSPVGDMLVGPRIQAPTGPRSESSPVLRTLLVWQGVGGPIIIGDDENDLRAERFLAWSEDGHRAAILGTLGDVRAVWEFKVEPGEGRERPIAVSPELTPSVGAVGAAFAGNTLFVAAEGKLYTSGGKAYREVPLPKGAPPPTGPMLWLDQ